MEQIVFHVDVNSAFLSWSALKKLKEEPGSVDLRTIPSAVGGDVTTRHGVITAKSIPAKKYGITTGEPVVKALQKCPNLVLVPSDFGTYRKFSRALMTILKGYANEVQQASIDEAYLDMTDRFKAVEYNCSPRDGLVDSEEKQEPLRTAEEIRDRVLRELGFTVNVGVSSNKLLAKMASDFKKPGRVHTLWPEEIGQKMWPLPIGDLYGCGRKTAERLNTLGIFTIGDAAAADEELLVSFLGEMSGRYIHAAAMGNTDSVVSGEREEAKSYSNETTIRSDITAESFDKEAPPIIKELSESVGRRLKRDGFYAGTIDVSVKTDDFRRFSRQTGIGEPTNDEGRIYETALRLMRELLYGDEKRPGGVFGTGRSIRLIGVGTANLDRGEYRQIDLFSLGLDKAEVPDRAEAPGKTEMPDLAESPDQTGNPEGKGISYPANAHVSRTVSKEKEEKARRMLEEIHIRYGAEALTKGTGQVKTNGE